MLPKPQKELLNLRCGVQSPEEGEREVRVVQEEEPQRQRLVIHL